MFNCACFSPKSPLPHTTSMDERDEILALETEIKGLFKEIERQLHELKSIKFSNAKADNKKIDYLKSIVNRTKWLIG
jgi:hypothetical protein